MGGRAEADGWLVKVSERLGDLRNEVVFLVGATIGLLVTKPAAYVVRQAKNVDNIVELGSFGEYTAFRDKLRPEVDDSLGVTSHSATYDRFRAPGRTILPE